MRPSQSIASLPLFLILSIALIASQGPAADFTGRVVGVSEGDTLTVLYQGKPERIRLYGIDCPEKRQAFGAKRLPLLEGVGWKTRCTRYGFISWKGSVILWTWSSTGPIII